MKDKQIDMGCDGGSIPRRDEMVKLKKKAEKVSELDILIDQLVFYQEFFKRRKKVSNWLPNGGTVL